MATDLGYDFFVEIAEELLSAADYAYYDDGGAFTDDTADFNDVGAGDVDFVPAAPLVDDAFYIGDVAAFQGVLLNVSTTGTAGTFAIEYYNGSAWVVIPRVYDESNHLINTGKCLIHFNEPSDWAAVAVNGQSAYWIRFRVTDTTSMTQSKLTQGWIIRDAQFGTSPSSYTWEWIGQIQNFESNVNMSNKTFRYLPDENDTDTRGVRDIHQGTEEHGCTIELYPQKDSGVYTFDNLLQHALGSLTTPTNKVRALSIYASDGSDYYRLIGSKINSLSIEVALGEPVTVSLDIVSKDTLVTAATTPTHASEITSAPVMWDDCTFTIAASEATSCTDFSLEINNNLVRLYRIYSVGATLIYGIAEKGRGLSGSATFNFESQTELSIMLASTAQTIVMVVGDTTITLTNCKWDDTSLSFGPDDLVSMTIPFTAETIAIT